MLGLFSLKKDLRVYIAGSDKPQKYTWTEMGEYLASEAYLFSKADLKNMRNRRQTQIITRFLNTPSGTRMLSTAFYLFIHYKTVSKLLDKGNQLKNRQALHAGFELGLSKIRQVDKGIPMFNAKHIEFMVRYMHFLMDRSRDTEFIPGKLYSTSLYKFYKMSTANDPVLDSESKELASYMNKRFIECNKRISKRVTIKTL